MCVSLLSHTGSNTTFLSKARLLFSYASAEVRSENTPERKFVSTGNQTHNHQIMSQTCSPLSDPARVFKRRDQCLKAVKGLREGGNCYLCQILGKTFFFFNTLRRNGSNKQFLPFLPK